MKVYSLSSLQGKKKLQYYKNKIWIKKKEKKKKKIRIKKKKKKKEKNIYIYFKIVFIKT